MLSERRRRDICQLIEQSGYVESRQLALSLGVDVSTIRRDLEALADAGLVQRTHGGAMPIRDGEPIDVPYDVKRHQRLAAKRAIANYAASLVARGESLVLDSGTTTFALAQALRARRDITVATNDLRIAHYLAEGGGVRLLVTGGQVIDSVFTLVGPSALTTLGALQVDWAFLGADAVDAPAGVTNVNTVEVPIKQAMLATAAQKVLLADSSKFGRRALAAVVGIHAFDHIITDTGLPADQENRFGGRLVRVPVETGARAKGDKVVVVLAGSDGTAPASATPALARRPQHLPGAAAPSAGS